MPANAEKLGGNLVSINVRKSKTLFTKHVMIVLMMVMDCLTDKVRGYLGMDGSSTYTKYLITVQSYGNDHDT